MLLAGFTLVEILVAFVIFIIGILPLMGLLAGATRNHAASVHEVRTSLLARLIMDEIQAAGQTKDYTDSEERAHKDYPQYRYDLKFYPLNKNKDAVVVEIAIYHKLAKNKVLQRIRSVVRQKS